MTFKLPDFLKTTGRTCHVHGCPTFYIDGKERCGGCDDHKAKKKYFKKIGIQMNDSKLDEYNQEKADKKQKLQEGRDNKSKAYKD